MLEEQNFVETAATVKKVNVPIDWSSDAEQIDAQQYGLMLRQFSKWISLDIWVVHSPSC